MFNDASSRLLRKPNPCLFNYFEEPWAHPLYSDRFWNLLDNAYQMLESNYNYTYEDKQKYRVCLY